MDDEQEYTQDQLDNSAFRRMLAEEVKKLRCNGLARKIESGFDINPRTLAAIELCRRLLGMPPSPPLD